MAATLVHIFIMHMYARGHMYTHTLINKCIKKLSSSHVLECCTRRYAEPLGIFTPSNMNSLSTQPWQLLRTDKGHTERLPEIDMIGVCLLCVWKKDRQREQERRKKAFCHTCLHQGQQRTIWVQQCHYSCWITDVYIIFTSLWHWIKKLLDIKNTEITFIAEMTLHIPATHEIFDIFSQ